MNRKSECWNLNVLMESVSAVSSSRSSLDVVEKKTKKLFDYSAELSSYTT